MKGHIHIIAGSDSGGGAGIQADIKTVTALGGYASTTVTALTAQNTTGVQNILDIPQDFILEQLKSVTSDFEIDAFKTGMLSNADIVTAVAEQLDAFDCPVVVDPVMVAKGGASLLEDAAVDALKNHLIPLSNLITPNIPEAEILTGKKIVTIDDMQSAVPDLLALGAENILLKGGHLEGDMIVDLLITPTQNHIFTSSRIHTKHTHGTGCTLASAIATSLAQEITMVDAVEKAREYVLEAIRQAPKIGSGHGPLNHMAVD